MDEATQQPCPWCNVMNEATEAQRQNQPAYCTACGHRTDVAPDDCNCLNCRELNWMLIRNQSEQVRKQNH